MLFHPSIVLMKSLIARDARLSALPMLDFRGSLLFCPSVRAVKWPGPLTKGQTPSDIHDDSFRFVRHAWTFGGRQKVGVKKIAFSRDVQCSGHVAEGRKVYGRTSVVLFPPTAA